MQPSKFNGGYISENNLQSKFMKKSVVKENINLIKIYIVCKKSYL